MAKPATKKGNNKPSSRKNNQTVQSSSLFDRIELFLQKNAWRIFWVIFGLTLLISGLLYDPRVSLSGDDSGYILRAYNFAKDFTFPGFQGPLYPIVLSLLTAIFGISLLPLKLFSMLSILAFMYITFISFCNRIPYLLLFSVLFLTSVNAHILFYASQTYSEAFYMFMQALVMLVFFKHFIDDKSTENSTLKNDLKRHALLALVLLGAILTRTVGFALFLGIIVYFISYKQWKNLGLSIVFLLVFYMGYEGIKMLVWGGNFQFSSQGSGLFNKNYYAPQDGKEDIAGLITRFFKNSNLYLSKHFYTIIGLRERVGVENLSVKSYPILTIITYIIAILGLFLAFRKKNKYIYFSGLIAGAFLIVTFVSLQVSWDQSRLIIPIIPLMLLIIFAAIYYLLNTKQLRFFQFLFIAIVILLSLLAITDASKEITKARKLKNEFSGLTPDWTNYLKASEWAGKNLPKESLVACRKPEMSSIYAKGKRFYGISRVPSGNMDLFMKNWKNKPENYILLPAKSLNSTPIPIEFAGKLKENQLALVYVGEDIYVAIDKFDEFAEQAELFNLNPVNNIEEMESKINLPQTSSSIFYPDSLLIQLKDANVTHVLTASLRSNPYVKTGGTINTVERYMSIIQNKYSNLFQPIINFGNADNEPAQIHLINWDQYKK